MLRRTCVARRLVASSYLQSGESKPFEEKLAQHQAAGEDFTGNVQKDFVQLQFALIPYRIEKFVAECGAIKASPGLLVKAFDPKMLLRLIVLYIVFVWMARWSFMQLQAPPVAAESTEEAKSEE
jgi:hypothetical protein